jgi:hypothetical protein
VVVFTAFDPAKNEQHFRLDKNIDKFAEHEGKCFIKLLILTSRHCFHFPGCHYFRFHHPRHFCDCEPDLDPRGLRGLAAGHCGPSGRVSERHECLRGPGAGIQHLHWNQCEDMHSFKPLDASMNRHALCFYVSVLIYILLRSCMLL